LNLALELSHTVAAPPFELYFFVRADWKTKSV
jgi:hypothetical protein